MGYDPNRANRFSVEREGKKQRFHYGRVALQSGKDALGHIHELGGVAVNRRAARTGISRHGVVSITGIPARDRFPPKHFLSIKSFQETQPSGIGPTHFESDVD